MDESWRMRMGKPTSSAACFKTKHICSGGHRSTTDEVPHRKSSDNPLLEADDFNDVFGGPPRTVISRQFSGNEYFVFPAGGSSSSSSCFYEDVFQPKEKLGSPSSSPARGRKSLPEFLCPAERGGCRSDQFEAFYGDIFGWKEEETKRSRSRSRSKSKMGSSWAVSSEDMSPSQPAVGAGVFGHDDIALLALKLRSINVSRRWHSNEPTEEDIHKEYDGISSNYPSSRFEYDPIDNIIKSSNNGFRRKNPSPEDTLNPPSSVASSLSKDHEAPVCGINQERGAMQGGIEAMRSYVIEINGNQRKEERDDAIGVEEAIAWAKEKFQTYCSLEELHTNQFPRNPNNFDESTFATENGEESDDWSSAEDKEQIDNNMEMELLNEKMRLWSSGKEADIRLLLSTLHHILWEDSHWVAVPITNLLGSRDVKKVYQTARLLLHPDKLQQKGATCLQKYIAHKAFPILQDAWAAFVSQDDIKK